MNYNSIAIDGPAGAGKSTLARQVAQALNYLYIDTGAIYRTVALYILQRGVAASDSAKIVPLLSELEIRVEHTSDAGQRMFLDGKDVSLDIRAHRVSGIASVVAAIPQVRAFLLEFQRKQAREHHVVMDGRDIGTVVLPHANVKIYLTAQPESRARRRLMELEQRGEQADFERILQDIMDRDEQDKTRAIAPLRQAEDALLLDTTQLNLEQSLQAMLSLIKEKIAT